MRTLFKFASTAALALATTLVLSCSSGSGGSNSSGDDPSSPGGSDSPSGGGTLTDKGNDISKYATKVIGTQTWMTENLDYNVDGSKCYDNNTDNCAKYGRLYTWDIANTVCPSGWHLPTDAEWETLINVAGGENVAGKKLKATSGWNSNGNGTDDFGFAALPGGGGNPGGSSFLYVGNYGHWWSASESDATGAYARIMSNSNERAKQSNSIKEDLFSVRCVKDGSVSNLGSSSSVGGGTSSSVVSITDKGNNISDYETVDIGDQTWMAENLNYYVEGSKCYDNRQANCDKYGMLYDWATAMALPNSCNSGTCSSQINTPHRGICPEGWHIPTRAEWGILMTTVGGESTAGTKLKAISGWNAHATYGNGTDDYDFAALPGGSCNSNGSFYGVGDRGYWWSASENTSIDATYWSMSYNSEFVLRSSMSRLTFYSVRCVKD